MSNLAPAYAGDPYISAGWRYSSGTGHFAYDVVMPIGTPVFAVGAGQVLASNDGVPNDEDQPGDTDYTNEPSNWILLGTHWNGKPISVLYQHLSPGHGMRPGMNVGQGDKLGAGGHLARSGDSGNTSGPHLHLATMHGFQSEATRYVYMSNDGANPFVIYPPSQLWKDYDMPLSDREKRDIAQMTVDELLSRKLFAGTDKKELKDVKVLHSFRRSYLGHDDPAEIMSPAETAARRD